MVNGTECCIGFLDLGVVSSPNYPGQLPRNLETTQTVHVEEGLILSLEFTEFDIACPYTYLVIMDGDGTTLMEKSCGPLNPRWILDEGNILVVGGQNITSALPPNVRSRSNTVNIIFVTEPWRTIQRSGWSLTWSAIQPGGSIFILLDASASLGN